MHIPVLSLNEFLDYLKENGCEVIEKKYWDDFNRIMLRKGDITFPLQCADRYQFPIVCKTCETLGIKAPPDHQKCYDQIRAYWKREQKKNKKK